MWGYSGVSPERILELGVKFGNRGCETQKGRKGFPWWFEQIAYLIAPYYFSQKNLVRSGSAELLVQERMRVVNTLAGLDS